MGEVPIRREILDVLILVEKAKDLTTQEERTVELEQENRQVRRPGWDAFVLALLVFAQMQIWSFGEDSMPREMRLNDILRHPILGNIVPSVGEDAFGAVGPRPTDPIGLLLNALTLGFLAGYLLIDLVRASTANKQQLQTRLKWLFLAAIVLTTLYLPTAKLILLRNQSGPASYTHDGGVIQTESTIEFFLHGKNPYVEEYVDTPMAEWGFNEYRTALYHYPYLPWTFVFSAPFYLIGQAVGFYDQRIVYLLLMAVALVLSRHLVDEPRRKFALVACLALNPIMSLDIIFGQNDSYVLGWIVLSLVCWRAWDLRLGRGVAGEHGRMRWLLVASALLFGLACASKPTAWFLAPFYGLLLVRDQQGGGGGGWLALLRAIPMVLRRAWPALLIFGLLVAPYLIWNVEAFYDDVWRWSNGQGETGYQIWGWGASNFVLAFGLVSGRFALWPFWILELLIALPVLLWFVRRQQIENTLANAAWHYGLFLLIFFYGSRFLNENYLGYIFAFVAIGFLTQQNAEHDDCL